MSLGNDYDQIDRFLRNNLGDDDYAEYSAALERIAAAQVDAARYRWLRTPHVRVGHGDIHITIDDRASIIKGYKELYLQRLDAAIDAALKGDV